MKEIMGSAAVTNILFGAFLALVGYVFIDHARMPWHGDVGVKLAIMETQLDGIHADVERIKVALDVDD